MAHKYQEVQVDVGEYACVTCGLDFDVHEELILDQHSILVELIHDAERIIGVGAAAYKIDPVPGGTLGIAMDRWLTSARAILEEESSET